MKKSAVCSTLASFVSETETVYLLEISGVFGPRLNSGQGWHRARSQIISGNNICKNKAGSAVGRCTVNQARDCIKRKEGLMAKEVEYCYGELDSILDCATHVIQNTKSYLYQTFHKWLLIVCSLFSGLVLDPKSGLQKSWVLRCK